jgi:23S rRNA (cytidine1920-2'-O)/16S rRNA (cytidine1409-2'-O)-methyltransferase
VAGQVCDKPGRLFPEDTVPTVRAPPRFVSRGGEKLEAAFLRFPLDVRDRVCVDIGASTGGFTDALLQHGAARVYAIDVGRAQLHPRIAGDPRVVTMDRFNARRLTPADLPESPSFATVDVSFISLKLILPALFPVLTSPSEAVTLIKPQFEAGRGQVGRGGVVRDEGLRAAIVEDIRGFGESLGLKWIDVCPSPLPGPAGNVEFLAYWRKS